MMDWRVLVSAAGVIGIIAGAGMVFRWRTWDLRASMIFVFTIYYFASLSTSSGLVPLPDVMAEHRTYKPSIGALAVLACLLDIVRTRFLGRGVARFAVPAAAALWVAVLSHATLARNEVWSSTVSLWSDTAAKSPNKWRPWFNLGCAYGEAGRLEDAERCFRKVLELESGVMLAHSNLATVLIQQQKHREALSVCRDAAARGIATPELEHTLGVSQCFVGKVDEGIRTLSHVLTRRPAYRPTHLVLGAAYAHRKREELALTHYRKAASLGPEDPALTRVIREIENRVDRKQVRRASQ
jgi:Flp pilus assembly protein TadD